MNRNMRLKCKKCQKPEELTGEQIGEFSEIVRKRKLKSNRYMKLFSAVSDSCPDGSEHEFVLDDKDVRDTLDSYKSNDELETVNSKAKGDVLVALEEAKKTVEMMEKGLADLQGKININIENKNGAVKQVLEKTGIDIESWL